MKLFHWHILRTLKTMVSTRRRSPTQISIRCCSLLTRCVCLSLLWPVSSGLSCSSLSHSPDSSCSSSLPCRASHPTELAECAPDVPISSPPSLPAGVRQCRKSGYVVLGCEPPAPVNWTSVSESPVESVDVELSSLNYRQFAMNVSWTHDYNPTSGYEVRVLRDDILQECYCISDPDARGIYLDDTMTYAPFSYSDVPSGLKVKVFPIVGQLPRDEVQATISREWPEGCLEISHSEGTCGLPMHPSPSDVTVYKHSKSQRQMSVSVWWRYKTVSTLPTTSYVELYNAQDIGDYQTFVVHNANSVTISQLDSSKRYLVRVQAYAHCSGLASQARSLGCGLWSSPVSPKLATLHTLLPVLQKAEPSEKKP